MIEARKELGRLGREYGLEVDPDTITGTLPVGKPVPPRASGVPDVREH